MARIGCQQKRLVWTIAVAIMLVMSAVPTAVAASSPVTPSSTQDNIILETSSEGTDRASDPLEDAATQLMMPLTAGVPPPPVSADKDGIKALQAKEQRYIQRLEADRIEKQGSLYVEPLPNESVTPQSGRIRFSGEPLPWDGLSDSDELGDKDNVEFSSQSYSPWGGEFRYEAIPRDQSVFEVMQVDQDDGSAIVDEQQGRLELETWPAVDGPGQTLKVEETGEDIENVDPNIEGNVREAVEPQVWDADGPSQKSQSDHDRNSQEYIQEAKAAENVDGDCSLHPEPDEIDLVGYESELDWLNEQDRRLIAWRARHHQHQANSPESNDEQNWDVDSADNEATMVDSGHRKHVEESTMSPEEIFSDPKWHIKHGGLNSKHFKTNTHNPFQAISRVDQNDIDEGDTMTPDTYSTLLYSKIVYPNTPNNPEAPLGYIAYNRQGDRIMDFSMVGWNEGNTDLPNAATQVPVLASLSPRPGSDSNDDRGDDTDRIQALIDRVTERTSAKTQANTVVPTGALVLTRGIFRISRPLNIRGSGILLRGDPAGGTRIVCQWEPTGHRYAIVVQGKKDKVLQHTRTPILSDYTPVGSYFLALDPAYFRETGLTVGDKIIVTRVGNDRWIQDIGMDDFDSDKKGVKPWKKMRGRMYRTIRSLNTQTGIAQLDAPLPISIWRHYGGGWVTKYTDNKIRAVGIQFLDLVFPRNIGRSTDDMLDEKGRGSEDYRFSYEIFANYALRMDRVQHAYVSHVTTAFFHNFVSVGTDAHHITFDSVVHSYPNDMLSGQSAFQLSGQLVLIKNSLSQGSFHFFVNINHVMGPNVVHRAQAVNVGKAYQAMPLDFAPGEVGPHMKFCTGMLFDQVVTDGSIQIVNRGDMGSGQGFSGANSVVWNSRAREGILTHRGPGFQNFVIGSEDFEVRDRMSWVSHGWKEHVGSEVLPGSLYLRQLNDRMNRLARGWVA
ncbi:hypothetical protein BG004_004419 [Podila humilis]|nr:hypothetical protein BG004_004419 [Podila humilis]